MNNSNFNTKRNLNNRSFLNQNCRKNGCAGKSLEDITTNK